MRSAQLRASVARKERSVLRGSDDPAIRCAPCRLPVTPYCDTRLKLLFDSDQTRQWIDLKTNSDDAALRASNEKLFLDEMRGAHLQLLSMAITKEYRDINMMVEVPVDIRPPVH